MLIFLVVALVAAALAWGIAVLLTGRDPGLEPVEPDGRAVPLPTARPLTESDLGVLRFDLAPRGYRMGQVDQALRRTAYDIGYKEELITVLEAEVAALREGRQEEAETLRQAREAAQRPRGAAPATTEPATTEPAATEPAGADLAGMDIAGTDIAGTELAGTELAGPEFAAPEFAGPEPVTEPPVAAPGGLVEPDDSADSDLTDSDLAADLPTDDVRTDDTTAGAGTAVVDAPVGHVDAAVDDWVASRARSNGGATTTGAEPADAEK
jgi:DivIVA domain-containing protein